MTFRHRGTISKAQIDNKSSLSYRPGVSIPGTTKHIPGFASIPVAVKSAVNQRDEGVIADQELKNRALNSESHATTYAQAHTVDPNHDYTRDPRQGGGYWAAGSAQIPVALTEPKPFLGKSTYQCDIAAAAGNIANLSQCAAEASPDSSSDAFKQPQVKPGYLTQYTAASLPVQQKLCKPAENIGVNPAAGSSALQTSSSPVKGGESLAHACTVLSHFDGQTTYKSMYTAGSTCATEELNKGTPLSSLHVPGYSGYVPSDKELALAAGRGSHAGREDVQLYHLDQHSRGLTPGYTGHRPAHKERASLQPPPPSAATTQGAAHQQALRWAEYKPPSAALNSRTGTMSFFSSGGGGGAFVSENGQAEAAMYHQIARPYEG